MCSIGLDGYDGPVVISLGNNIRPCCLGPCFVGLLRAIRNVANIPHFLVFIIKSQNTFFLQITYARVYTLLPYGADPGLIERPS